MTKTWFDIAFAISTNSQFTNNSTQKIVAVIKHIFRYLKKHLVYKSYIRKATLFLFMDTFTQTGLWIQLHAVQQSNNFFLLQVMLLIPCQNASTLSLYT